MFLTEPSAEWFSKCAYLVTTAMSLLLCLMAVQMFFNMVKQGTKSLLWIQSLYPSSSDSKNSTSFVITHW